MSDSSTKPSLPSTPRHNRLIFALDVPGRAEALPLITALATEVGYFKVGLEMMCGPDGVEVVRTVIGAGGRVFLDMKLHDIPATVERAAMNAGRLGANFLTVHALGGATMMRAAVKGAAATNPNLRILAITILTSHAPQDLVTIGLITPAEGERARGRSRKNPIDRNSSGESPHLSPSSQKALGVTASCAHPRKRTPCVQHSSRTRSS